MLLISKSNITEVIDMSNVRVSKGYKSRNDYLKYLAEKYGVNYKTVCNMMNRLGAEKDFNRAVSILEDALYLQTV
jgi:hypothetical protein